MIKALCSTYARNIVLRYYWHRHFAESWRASAPRVQARKRTDAYTTRHTGTPRDIADNMQQNIGLGRSIPTWRAYQIVFVDMERINGPKVQARTQTEANAEYYAVLSKSDRSWRARAARVQARTRTEANADYDSVLQA